MAEYIEREALIDEFDRLGLGDHSFVERVFSDGVRTIVAGIPAADVVPVVRCKDCRYWGDADGISTNVDGVRFARCRAHNHYVAGMHIGWCPAEDDFCSYGAREDGDDDAKAD